MTSSQLASLSVNEANEPNESPSNEAASTSIAQRPTRSLRSNGRSQRSRTPSELLARKQRLLNGGATSGGDLPSPGATAKGNSPEHSLAAGSQIANAAELKLESLSQMVLKNQSSFAADETQQQVSIKVNGALAAASAAAMASIDNNGSNHLKSIDDVYILLAKKEKDLQLAAELGKALLERNDELSKTNERLAEDYSHKLELLEEEKHKLKRKLDQVGGEYENRLIDLQTECNILKNQLDQSQESSKRLEKEKSKLIDDLVQQNQRLTGELIEATKAEELLSSQLEQINDRHNARLGNRQEQTAQVEALKEEISIVNQRKQEFERRLKVAQSDKLELKSALDESNDKLILMDHLLNERSSKLADLALELGELRDSSAWLSGKLESMISLNERLLGTGFSSDPSSTTGSSLRAISEDERAKLIEQLKDLRVKGQSRSKANDLMLLRSTIQQQQQQQQQQSSRRSQLRSRQRNKHRTVHRDRSLADELLDSSSLSGDDEPDEDDVETGSAQSEWSCAAEVFALLQHFEMALQQRKEAFNASSGLHQSSNGNELASSSAEDSGISGDENLDQTRVAMLQQQPVDATQWKCLLSSLKKLIEEMPCKNCQIMIGERNEYEQLRRLYAKLNDESRKQNELVLDLEAKNLQQETKLNELNERCSILAEDLRNCDNNVSKEEIVSLAWKARDEAVERKNACEIALAKTRIENMQINSQLMEVVQQKGELSQKLAQFEDDIHYITQHSVKAKFTWEEYAEKLRNSSNLNNDRRRSSSSSTSAANGLSHWSQGQSSTGNLASNSKAALVQLLAGFGSYSSTLMSSTGVAGNGRQVRATMTTTKSDADESPGKNSTLDSSSTGLMRNFASNNKSMFNGLRFWQKTATANNTRNKSMPMDSSVEKPIDNTVTINNNNNNNA